MDLLLIFLWITPSLLPQVNPTVVAPPWSDPNQNPCVSKPNGWQLIFWPPDEKCYKIFQKGYPCPETMELAPGRNGNAECQCPPGTAQSPRDGLCHKIFTKGPCNDNEYFAPVASPNKSPRHRWGACFQIEICNESDAFWAKDGKCYPKIFKGPCPNGLLLSLNGSLGQCICDNSTMSSNFWSLSSSCYEHYIQGPCEKGQIFLPGGICGCNKTLKEYNLADSLCYAIGSIGPCKIGQQFVLTKNKTDPNHTYGNCICKEGHMFWEQNGNCYRPFTRGPCEPGYMLDIMYKESRQILQCVRLPCPVGKLYFRGGKGCHSVGTRGPCPSGQVVLFHETKEKSTEGISYHGACGCSVRQSDENTFYPSYRMVDFESNAKCPETRNLDEDEVGRTLTLSTQNDCSSSRELVLWHDNTCKNLYTQGPCNDGEWVVPDRGKGQRKGRGWKMGKCECRPTYTMITLEDGSIKCQPPSFQLAKFLSNRY